MTTEISPPAKYETAIPTLDKEREKIQEDFLQAWVPEEKREQARKDLKTLGYCIYGVEAISELWEMVLEKGGFNQVLWNAKERLTDSLESRA